MQKYKIVSSVKDIDMKKWDEFVLCHPKANFFYSKEYYYSLKETEYYDAIVVFCIDPDNELLMGMSIAAIQSEYKGILRKLTSRCIILGEPLALNDDISIKIKLAVNLDQNIKRKVILTEYRFFYPISTDLFNYFIKDNYIYEPYLNITNDTSIDINNLWSRLYKSRKDGIEKARRQGFTFKLADYDENINVFYQLLSETYYRIKRPFPRIDYFQSLKKNIKPECFKLFELTYGDMVIVSLIAILSKNILYAYYIGIKNDNNLLNLRPVDLFYWEVLKWCSQNGVQKFDWLGAGNKNKKYGVRDFKKRYGGTTFEPGRMKKYSHWIIKATFKYLFSIWKIYYEYTGRHRPSCTRPLL